MSLWPRSLARTTATVMVAVYVALSISAAFCLFTHDGGPRTAPHHTGAATHSSLCAWACQASQSVDLVSISTQSEPLVPIALLLSASSIQPSLFVQQSAQSRAPPLK